MELRPYCNEDTEEILHLIQDTIREVNRFDYDAQQIWAWSFGFQDSARWQKRLSDSDTWVAVQDVQIIGVASLYAEVLDLLYMHKDFQHQCVGKKLVQFLEERAVQSGLDAIETESSLTAKPFFTAQGFRESNEQTRIIRGISIKNFRMCKKLNT
ncbi:GNAT family N-acetyltransferase [Halobacillus mangrovi]|uniref:GNAT family N-acetyltransferase n=1 Tax=Halobacillus mangrovi TaxID=402384 RepID=UPI003D953792